VILIQILLKSETSVTKAKTFNSKTQY